MAKTNGGINRGSRISPQKRWRNKQFDLGKCMYCNADMPENDLRTCCIDCRSWNRIRAIARRAFEKDFK